MDDTVAIQRLIADFALRDRNDWSGLAKLFSPHARLRISWFEGEIEGFLQSCEQAAARGAPPTKHWFGCPRVDLSGDRAVAETDVQIMVRAGETGAQFDVTSWARFLDLLERRDGRWLILRRTAIYERDRLDRVDPTQVLELPREQLARYPSAYRYLAFLLSKVGMTVAADTIVAGSREESALWVHSQRWLRGEALLS